MLFNKFLCKFLKNKTFNLPLLTTRFKNYRLFPIQIKSCSSTPLQANKLDQNEKNEEEPQLREIQKRPKYESAIACLVSGDNKRALKTLIQLKEDLNEENKVYTSDYLFLLKKIISAYKFQKEIDKIPDVMNEYYKITLKIYDSDLNSLFSEVEYIAINLINIDPKSAILFLKEIIENQIFPPFFNHIFLYYLGTSFLLVGVNYMDAIQCLKDSLNSVEDNYLKSCILNNYCCALLWEKSTQNMKKFQDIDNINTAEYSKQATKEIFEIVKKFKETIFLTEGIDLKYEDNIDFDLEKMAIDNDEEKKKVIIKFVLSKNFDLKTNITIVKELGKVKATLVKHRVSGLIFSNLGEIYFMMKEYKKALVYLSISNLFFNDFDKYDPIYYKNFALIANCDYEITGDIQKAKKMFDKVINIIKHYQGIYEKIYIYQLYSNFLLKDKNTEILGYDYAKQAEEFLIKTPYFEGRKSYLIVPNVNSEEKQ